MCLFMLSGVVQGVADYVAKRCSGLRQLGRSAFGRIRSVVMRIFAILRQWSGARLCTYAECSLHP